MKYCFLLPAYKTEFLADSIQSILNQSYSGFTLVVSDDCSPNPVGEIVRKIKDPRIQYRRNEKNLGAANLVDHWNLLLSQCDSEYLIMAADDDVYAPDFLEEVDRLVRKYPNVDLIHVQSRCIDAEGNTLKEDPRVLENMSYEDFLHHFLSLDNILCIGNFVFRTEALKRIGGFVKFPLAWKSDTATQIALAHNGIANTSDILFCFRNSGINISSQTGQDFDKNRMKLEAIIQFDKWLMTELENNLLCDYTPLRRAFKKRLEGEARSYYKSLSFKEFILLYWEFVSDGWFTSFRNSISFIYGWCKR